ncbi:MAG: vWA domain-containing protein [bacterium]
MANYPSAQAAVGDSCGEQPVNICIMMDRTGSVSSTERTDEATAAKGLIDQIATLNNGTKVGIGRFGDATNGGSDAEMRDAEPSTPGTQTFTTNYTQAKSAVDSALSSSSSVGTNLEDAVEVCRNALIANRVPNSGIQDIMILISDGDANDRDEASPDNSSENQNENDDDPFNSPDFSDANYDAALDAAREAKGLDPYLQSPLTTLNPGIRIFTIAFGAEANGDATARKLLAMMASGNAQDDHCDDTGDLSCSTSERASENTDGDDFFISPKTQAELAGVLSEIFKVLQCEDDGNACTVESCNDDTGLCESKTIENCKPCKSSADCDDGNSCNGAEVCGDKGTCMSGTPLVCNDNNPCTNDSCDPSTRLGCKYVPKDCSDGLSCTADSCDSQSGECKHDTASCECTNNSMCNDGNPCTDDVCNLQTFACEHRNDDTNSCGDGLFCNGTESCQTGQCKHSGNPCAGGGECADSCDETKDSCNDPAGTACTDDGNVCTDNQCNGQGACVAVNNTASCDDGDKCTEKDLCSGGKCGGTEINCDDGISCTPDSCNPDTGACENPTDECECNSDADCNDGNSCTDEYCNEEHECVRSNNSDPCDDGLFCNGKDTCGAGSCSIHAGDPCATGGECADSCNEEKNSCNDPIGTACTDDGNVCTDNQCNGQGACVAVNNTASCDDGDKCTEKDLCSGGKCGGTEINCDDGISCTPDSCNPDTGACENPTDECECNSDADCNDGNSCTDEYCNEEHECVRSNNSDPCDDGLFCNGKDTCGAGSCSVHAGDPCAGGGECADSCDEAKNSCNDPEGTVCTDDGNVCTDNQCNGQGACVAVNNSASCDDGDLCSEKDICSGGECNGKTKNCDDGIECTPDSCNPDTGACENPTDECECNSDADCDDGNSCTDEYCSEEHECVRSNNSDPCNDGLFCNGKDTCGGGSCSIHAGDPCAGGGECADSCDEKADSCNDPAGTVCTDDGNVCTDNQCNGQGACVAVNNTASCDDGNLCTIEDTCSEGSCQSGEQKSCDDGRSCSGDSCDPKTGQCQNDLSECGCSEDPDCNDNNPCTEDACDFVSGTCSNTPNVGLSCDDGNVCTENTQCDEEGLCVGTSVSCSDGNNCTTDTCNPESGCEHQAIPQCSPCPDADDDGVCDSKDNCVNTPNPGQVDSNQNGVGDACEQGGDNSGAGPSGPTGPNCLQGSGDFGTGTNGCKGFACSLNRDPIGPSGSALASCLLLGLGMAPWILLQRRVPGRNRRSPR